MVVLCLTWSLQQIVLKATAADFSPILQIAVRSGIAAALWQHFVAARTNSCALTLADKVISGLGLDTRWPEVFEVRASCADAAVNLLGVPFAFWSLALFAALARLRTQTELAGACFSPDGRELFVNVYSPTKTLAITGPWI